MRKTLRMVLLALLPLMPVPLLAEEPTPDDQAVTVRGTVTDGRGPIPGVNVLLKGTSIGTATDAVGSFAIQATSADDILVFSFIGYKTQEIRIGTQTSITVTLEADVATLSEVVVVGAVLKTSDLTGSISSLSGDKLKDIPTASVTQAMTGRMTGVLIQNSPGVSGGASIKIRGNNSIQFGANPIFVVDGLIMDGGFNLINPSDIETINVLKDASATSIYGSRGANGVVLITTKKGKKGEGKVTYDGWYGIQNFSRTVPRMGAKDIFNLRADAYANAYMDANPGADRQGYVNSLLDPSNPLTPFAPYEFDTYLSGKSYNWLNEVTRSGAQQNHALSLSKATDQGSYFVSFNYTNNKGLMENSNYNRITGRLNLEQNVKPWLKVGTNTSYARSHETYVQGGVFSIANGANPLLAINDSINYLKWAGVLQPDSYNPIRSLRIKGDGYQSRIITSNYINVRILKKINVRSTFSADVMDTRDFWYTPHDIGQSIRNSTSGTAQQRNDHYLNWQWDNTATYDVLTGDHNLSVLGGFNMLQNNWDYNQVDATGFATDDFSYKYIGGAYLRDKFGLASDFTTYSLMSFIGRANYNYKDKYFATVTGRYDGSSRFDNGHKWGLFPSVALGWDVAKEQFFQNLNPGFVNLAKIRASYGIAGNQNIPNFAYKTLYYPHFSNNAVTFDPSGRLGNSGLVWERQKQLNLGLDLALINNVLKVSFDYFTINNEDLLMQRPLSTVTGFNNVIGNVGAMTNKGIEISVNAQVLNRGGVVWNVAGNISSARNKVTKLYGDVSAIYSKGGYTGVEIQREGNLFLNQSINSIYVFKFDRIVQESDMDYVKSLDLGGRVVKPGDILPQDVDHNGIINDDDRTVVGRKDPKFYGGFSTDLSFKNFTLNAVFTYNYGAKRISYLYEGLMNGTGMSAAHPDMLNRWTPTNTQTNVPRAYSASGRYGFGDVDLGIQNASFLRLSALTLAYNLPRVILDRAKISTLRIYFTGSNLFIKTKYKGYDPEGGDDYPMSRLLVTGVNVGF